LFQECFHGFDCKWAFAFEDDMAAAGDYGQLAGGEAEEFAELFGLVVGVVIARDDQRRPFDGADLVVGYVDWAGVGCEGTPICRPKGAALPRNRFGK
jgi:hypothetical protein